ncbi:MAG: hypothetical protein H7177_17380, partial [Rhizobacter sp.]|nr:hypothetical protein [Bacteriovorax sp.]
MKILVRAFSIAAVTITLAQAQNLTTPRTTLLGSGMTTFGIPTTTQDFVTVLDLQPTCDVHPFAIEPTVVDLSFGVRSVAHFYTCADSKDLSYARFSVNSCTKAATCRSSVEKIDANKKGVDDVLDAIIAKDMIKKSLIMHGEDMERLENLTKFAQKKYNTKLEANCMARFQQKSISECNLGFAESTFVNYQKECSFSIGCFNNDDNVTGVQSFANFQEAHKESKGKYMYDYYKYRVETKFNKEINNDDAKLELLGGLVASDSFKSLNTAQKLEKFMNQLGIDSLGRVNDPVLAYDLGTGLAKRFQTSDKLKDLIKLLETKNISSKDFAAGFDEFRKKRAQALLGSKSTCSETPTFVKICSEATAVLNGKKITKAPMEAENLSSKSTMTPLDLEKIRKYLGAGFDEKDFETLVNARRCVDFNLSDVYGTNINTIDSVADISGPNGGMNRDEANGFNPAKDATQASDNRSMRDIYESSGGKVTAEVKDETATSSDRKSTTSSSTEPVTETFADKVVPFLPSATNRTITSNNFSDLYGSGGFDTFAGKEKPKTDGALDKGDSIPGQTTGQSSQDKMNDYLLKKLASAEENLEKFKADAAAAEQDKAKQKKVDEETALIKDLKGQISDLKTQTAKSAQKKAADESAAVDSSAQPKSVSRNASANSGSGTISTRAEALAPAPGAENFDGAHISTAAASASRSIASSSGSVLTSVSNSDGSKTTTLASGLVVTTVDGMTAEKAALTISNRIIELNGTPFYIEEGGMVKEIIAVVKDGKVLLDDKGKPVFEKIVKGKVGDKKFAKVKNKDRAPAAITDAADLKRDQEEKLKRERAEYLKLKNLTNDALK